MGKRKTFTVRADTVVGGCYAYRTDHPTEWFVTGVWVTPIRRGENHSHKLLESVVQWADEHRYTLRLEPIPYGDGKKPCRASLERLYRSYGFIYDPEWVALRRAPVIAPRRFDG